MTIDRYLQLKEQLQKNTSVWRKKCLRCRKPLVSCYCDRLKPFASNPAFAILIHRMEARRSIATGRMAHLSLSNSYLFEGTDFSDHESVNALILDPRNYSVVLSPGPDSVDLTRLSLGERVSLFPPDKRPIVFVIDGTWSQAKRMKRLSRNLNTLPSICFTPDSPSRFTVRHQPAPHCYSTIEAIHRVLQLLSPSDSVANSDFLSAFEYMVNRQSAFVPA